MTRKHFEAIAAIVAKFNAVVPDGPIEDDWDNGYQEAVENFGHALADYFTTENINFDKDRFLTACTLLA